METYYHNLDLKSISKIKKKIQNAIYFFQRQPAVFHGEHENLEQDENSAPPAPGRALHHDLRLVVVPRENRRLAANRLEIVHERWNNIW